MQYFTITTVLTAFGAIIGASAAALPAASNSPATPLPSNSTLKWTGPSKGVNVTLYGTVSEIKSQLITLDPDWKPLPPPTKGDAVLEDPANVDCCPVGNWNWPVGNYNDVMVGVNELWSLGGSLGVEPSSCLETICASGTGIWACNQYSNSFLEIDASNIGNFAFDMDGLCAVSCGQAWSGLDAWNVIVHGGC